MATIHIGPIHIKKGAWICSGAIIQANVTIGEWAVVCAGAVVTKDVPAESLVIGIPAVLRKVVNLKEGPKKDLNE
jgi:acetyltransferase-like isoleucine patch superfamily enzyme